MRAAVVLGLVAVLGVLLTLMLLRRSAPAAAAPAAARPALPEAGPSLAAPARPRPAAPTSRPPGSAAAHGKTILSVPWGDGAGQLGRRADPEAVSEGPMSFVVDARGALVLDNVNRRIARFDATGHPLPPIALFTDAAQDVVRAAHDRLAVLDRLHDRTLTLYGSDGTTFASAALGGPGVPDSGGVTGVFADRDGSLYIESEHRAWLRLFDREGRPDPARTPAPGRPTRDGGFVRAGIVDRRSGTAQVQRYAADASALWEAPVAFGAPLMFIELLDSDRAGDVFVAAHTGHEAATPPYRVVDETLQVVALSPAGSSLGTLTLPAPPAPEEAFRELSVGDDGTFYWMRRSPSGVTIEAYRLF